MTAEILRRRVKHVVRAVQERVLQRRRRERRVDAQEGARGVRARGVRCDGARCAVGVERGLEVDEVAREQVGCRCVEWDFHHSGEAGEDRGEGVAAVVALAHGEALGVCVDEEGVEGCEAGGVGCCVPV